MNVSIIGFFFCRGVCGREGKRRKEGRRMEGKEKRRRRKGRREGKGRGEGEREKKRKERENEELKDRRKKREI